MTRHRVFDLSQPAFTEALEAVREELASIPVEKLETIRLDTIVAMTTALGVSPRVQALRERVVAQFGESAARHIDRIELVARALGGAEAEYRASLGGGEVAAMVDQLSDTRKLLLLEAQALVSRGHVQEAALRALVGGNAHKAMCIDVVHLASVFRAHWAAIESLTPVTLVELAQAEGLANAVLTTIGENEQSTSPIEPAAEMRRRAYTLLVRTYSQVRRLVTYFRWAEGDADEFAPSLFAGRARREKDDDDVIVPVTPVIGAPIAPGLPGGSPFVTSS